MNNNVKKILIALFIFIVASITIYLYDAYHFKYQYYESYGLESTYSENKLIEIENSIYYVNIGEELKINVLSSNSDELAWTSIDTNITTVDKSGTVKGISEGRTRVVASISSDEEATIEVVVVDNTKTTKEEVRKEHAKKDF